MPAGRWRDVRKIDAHAHVVLHDRDKTELVFNPPDAMLRAMDEQNVERAVVVPINYPEYFPLEGEERVDWLRANNERQAEIARGSDGRLICFADCAIDGTYGHPSRCTEVFEHAIRELKLAGLKIHAYNLRVPVSDTRLRTWIEGAARLDVPVIFHSNPCGHAPDFHGSAPSEIYRAVYGCNVTYTIAHLGGVTFYETTVGGGYVDISWTLLWLAELHGPAFCERLMRRIGIQRILFATDYPACSYKKYYEVLDEMAFTDEEIERIAYGNAERMLRGLPPVDPDD
jgi:predicted TIM-barrel fold metal-dependent hydrolase